MGPFSIEGQDQRRLGLSSGCETMLMYRRSPPRIDGDQTVRRPSLQFSVRTMVVATAIATVLTGCLILFLRSAGWLRRPIEFAPPPRWANTDHDLFDIVFSDLIEDRGFGIVGSGRSQLLVNDTTFRVTTGRLEDALGDHTKNVPAEIRADLVSRNADRNGYSMARYRPSNPDILVQDLRSIGPNIDFDLKFPNARAYVSPALPGYSYDGRMALLFLASGPTLHGCFRYYLLRKVKGRWEISLKGFYQVRDEG